jgi:hypothetical protein
MPITTLRLVFDSLNQTGLQLSQYFGYEHWFGYKDSGGGSVYDPGYELYATAPTITGWHTWELLRYDFDNYIWKRDGGVIETVHDSYWSAFYSFNVRIGNGFYPNSPANQCHEWDFVIIANYKSVEPTVSVGSETMISTCIDDNDCSPGYACIGGQCQESTLVYLDSFTATPQSNKVILNWTTAAEIDNAGFNLYRAESENGKYEQINASQIPAEGMTTIGATYEFIDTDAQNRKTYWYKLEDVDYNGTTMLHGPVKATPRLLYGVGR